MTCISGQCPPNVYVESVQSIANEINIELSDDSVTVPYICAWIRANMGAINDMLFANFQLDPNLQFCPAIHPIVKDIIKLNFYLRYYEKKSRSILLAVGANHITRLTDGRSTVGFESSANLARAWKELMKEIKQLLDERCDFYKRRLCTAVSVVGIPPAYTWNSAFGGLELVLTPAIWYGGYGGGSPTAN